jgi:enamine deaminase RidA (YjgF/YER057c/UK114 family)
MTTHSIEQRLVELDIELPSPPKPAGNYQPWMICGPWLFISGQVPIENGRLRHTGRVGAELTEEEGRAAARFTALNVLAQIRDALGGFERLAHLVRMEGHVASAGGDVDVPWVLDAASDLFIEVLGDRGKHTRSAFTPACLPKNLTLELVVTAMLRS